MSTKLQEIIETAVPKLYEHLSSFEPSVSLRPEQFIELKEEILAPKLSNSFSEYLKLLEQWNSTIDLVAPANTEVLVERHIIDSLAAFIQLYPYLSELPGGDWLDIGSGAGLPGVIFSILAPTQKVELIEPREKRVTFLKEVRRKLKLRQLSITLARFEEIQEKPASLIITRALGLEKLFLEESLRLLSQDGVAVLMAGPKWSRGGREEIVLGIKKLKIFKEISYSLASAGPERRLIIWKCFT